MSNETTILLYVLSTLAQTVAALAAFVGALGLFKLQLLLTSHGRTEDTIRGIMAPRLSPELSIDQIVATAREFVEAKSDMLAGDQRANLAKSLTKWDGFGGRFNRARKWLIGFEAWNLTIIVGSLLAFNVVERVAGACSTTWFIGIAVLGTAAMTVICVWKWSGD